MAEYQYSQLNEAVSEVRFLILLPGHRSSPLRGFLYVTPFDRKHSSHYEAISYAWGSSDTPSSIGIQTIELSEALEILNEREERDSGSTDNQAMISFPESGQHCKSKAAENEAVTRTAFKNLTITQNLRELLPYLRHEHYPRLLWIDAICVNQADFSERSSQVRRMADLYGHAWRVIAWLGIENSTTERAMNTLKSVSSQFYFHGNSTIRPIPQDGDESQSDMIDGRIRVDTDSFLSLHDFLGRSWFYRLWIWQEIQLANSRAILLCGDNHILWEDFRIAIQAFSQKAVTMLQKRAGSNAAVARVNEQLRHLAAITNLRLRYDFAHMSTFGRRVQCSDPRDRVYALLSLISAFELNIEPDYTLDVQSVYQATAQNIFQNTRSLNILRCCEISPLRLNIPTWVPDLRLSEPYDLCQSLWSVTSTCDQIKIHEGVLLTQGIQITTISTVIDPQVEKYGNNIDLVKGYQEMLSRLDLSYHAPYCVGEMQTWEALARTVAENIFQESYEPALGSLPSEHSLDAVHALIRGATEGMEESVANSLQHYCRRAKTRLSRKCLFRSVDGHVGLCSKYARVDDCIVFLVGCQVPLILRPLGGHQYSLVGETFCQGVMLGEPFLGPLATDIQLRVNRETGMPLFFNHITGTAQVEDPRLGGLPPGWRRAKHAHDHEVTIFRHEQREVEWASHQRDPRSTVEELKKRGIILRDFEIA